MCQTAAGAEPHAAIRIGPEGLPIAIIRNQSIFGCERCPVIGPQHRNSLRGSAPEVPQFVEAVKRRSHSLFWVCGYDGGRPDNAALRNLQTVDAGVIPMA